MATDQSSFPIRVTNQPLNMSDRGLVMIPLNSMYFTTDSGYSPAWDSPANGDGSGMGYTFVLSAGGTNSLRVSTIIWGSTVGLRFRSRTGIPLPDLTIVVDGTPYRGSFFKGIQDSGSFLDVNSFSVIVDNLSDGLHEVVVILHSDPTTTKNYTIYGGIGSRSAGYKEPERSAFLSATGVLTASNVAIPTGVNVSYPDSSLIMTRGMKNIIYYNTSASTVTVTISFGVPAGVNTAIWSKVIAAGDSVEFSPASILSYGSGFNNANVFNHKASTAGVVNFSILTQL